MTDPAPKETVTDAMVAAFIMSYWESEKSVAVLMAGSQKEDIRMAIAAALDAHDAKEKK